MPLTQDEISDLKSAHDNVVQRELDAFKTNLTRLQAVADFERILFNLKEKK